MSGNACVCTHQKRQPNNAKQLKAWSVLMMEDSIPSSKIEECGFQDRKTCTLIKPTHWWLSSRRPSTL